MTDEPYNPEDAALLFSRSLDEDLSDEQQERLDQALAKSDALRAEADELRSVDRLMKEWGAQPAKLDWEPYAATIRARIDAEGDEDELRKVDEWIKRWGEKAVPVDEESFTRRVMAGIEPSRGRSPVFALVFRIGAPLAAAAAIALTLTATFWSGQDRDAICEVAIGPKVADVGLMGEPVGQSRPIISFRRTADMEVARSGPATGISTVWASPVSAQDMESAPL